MEERLLLKPVAPEEKAAFLKMAERHFKELNPAFVPMEDWRRHYFESIQANGAMSLQWILVEERRAGFVLFGFESHRFLPRHTGMIYELYVAPEYRRRGVGEASARHAVEFLRERRVSKIQLEVMDGNEKAAALWKKLGFAKVSERFVLGGAA
ncbi:MAG: GNAT family N-acetyltransferase [Candidatus Binatia bacterium]